MLLFHLTANQAGLRPPTLSNQLQMWVVVLFRIDPMAFPGFGCVIWDLKGLNPVAPGGTWRYQRAQVSLSLSVGAVTTLTKDSGFLKTFWINRMSSFVACFVSAQNQRVLL